MIQARDIMTTDVVTVRTDTEITEAARLMLSKKINGLPVIDDAGGLVGIICQSDLIAQQKKLPLPSFFTMLDGFITLTSQREIERELEKMSAVVVGEAMTRKVVTVGPEESVWDVATIMVEKNYHTLPVVENGRLVGVIGKEDVLKTIIIDQPPNPPE